MRNKDQILLESLYERILLKENDNSWEVLAPEKPKSMSDKEKRQRAIFFRDPNESPEITNDRIAREFELSLEDSIKAWKKKNITKEQEEELRNHLLNKIKRIREVGVAQTTIESMRWYMDFMKRISKNEKQ